MDSTGLISNALIRTIPFRAILRHDLRALASSWMVRFWLGGSLLLTMFILLVNWGKFETAPLIASALLPYLVFPWFLIVMVLGVTPLSGARAETLADGILSRPVTRHEYLMAIWCSRAIAVLSVYLVVMVPAVLVTCQAERTGFENRVTVYGAIATLGVVGLVLLMQVTFAFLVGTVLRSPLLSIVILLICWYPINGILSTFQLAEFSPISLSRALPTLLEKPWTAPEDPDELDESVNPQQLSDKDREAAEQLAQALNSVWGGPAVKSTPPKSDKTYYDNKQFEDFSLLRVLLGYGIPTLLSLGLALFCFSVRDI